MRLAESERHVMRLLWDNGEMTAKDIANQLKEKIGWSKTTTYTMLSRCIEKGYIKRTEPNFHCVSLLSQEEVARQETDHLISANYSGSADLLVASLIQRKRLSADQMDALYQALQELKNDVQE